ncbi:hypothetical protein GCM10027018_14420 [Paenibacillus thermoaerophilus]
MLEKTSRTFFIPISRMVSGLRESVASAYLCMRAIDEIEDHELLPEQNKIELLFGISEALRSPDTEEAVRRLLAPYREVLPEVSLRIVDWARLCPSAVSPTVTRYTAMMAEQMAEWVRKKWVIRTEADLDGYTYSVAGMVGEMLSELWHWHDGTQSDRAKAVAFGRGLQAVNILRNRKEDLSRGVDFYPDGWGSKEMLAYTRRNLKLADEYINELGKGPALEFCKIPLALAHATVKILAAGGNKLTRDAVLKIVNRLGG